MRITRIELKGDNGASAALERDADDATDPTLVIAARTPRGGQRFELAIYAPAEERWKAAARLQEAMEGRRGAQGDIAPYAHALELLADQ